MIQVTKPEDKDHLVFESSEASAKSKAKAKADSADPDNQADQETVTPAESNG